MACLLYCVTQPGPQVNPVSGVCDTAVESRELLGVRLYWSVLADPQACLGEAEALKKAALQFHQVLREVLAATTPIPFRFPTMLESDEAFEEHLAPEQELYQEALARVGNALQYEVVGHVGRRPAARSLAADEGARLSRAPKAGSRPSCSGGDKTKDCHW